MEIFGSERTDDGWSHSVTRRRFVVIVHFTNMNLKARIGILLSVICLSWYPFDCSATTLLDLQDGSSARESEEIDFRTFATRALKKSKGSKKAKSYKKSKSYDYEPMYHYHDSWTYETAYRPGKSDSYDYSSADYSSYSYSKKSKSGKKSKGFKSYKKYPFIYKYRSFKKSKKFKKYPKYSFKRPTRPEEPDDAEEPTQTILEIAAETLELSTLVTLVTSEGQENVLEMLKGEGPFTLFAPVNSAFDELFETLDPTTLTDEQISDVLFYHVVWDLYLEEDFIISESGILSASNGDPIQYDYDGDDVTLNNEVLIVTADILATNGVIHLVDKGKYRSGNSNKRKRNISKHSFFSLFCTKFSSLLIIRLLTSWRSLERLEHFSSSWMKSVFKVSLTTKLQDHTPYSHPRTLHLQPYCWN